MRKLSLVLSCVMAFWATGADEPVAKQETASPSGVDLVSLRDITGIETVPSAPLPRWPAVLAVALASLAALGVAGWKLSRRRASSPALPPDLWALKELERVEALRLAELGKVEQFHTLVADVIRCYLEVRFNLRAPRQTTREFLTALHGSGILPDGEQTPLRELLERCDLAKFAQAESTVDECRAVLASAREFVQNTMRR